MTDENISIEEIRRIIEEKAEAVRTKDVIRATAAYAPNVVVFDVVGPLQYLGSDSIRKRLEEWLSTFDGSIGFENREVLIDACEDAGFGSCLNHVTATTKAGGKLDMWWRETACYRKVAGRWVITHQHSSVPFNAETGKASIDLHP